MPSRVMLWACQFCFCMAQPIPGVPSNGYYHICQIDPSHRSDAEGPRRFDRPASGYRPHDFAADLAAFMDALDLRSGNRRTLHGGSVAKRFAWAIRSRLRLWRL